MKVKQSSRLLGILGAAAALSYAYVAASTSSSGCFEGTSGDGYCDQDNNNAECGYDGGDCCECTCQIQADDAGCEFFACIDPAALCVDNDDITATMVENCSFVRGIGDGYCDEGNNREECGFDGGDCCECTCVNVFDDDFSCSRTGSGFACVDPAAPCVDDDNVTIDQALNCFARGLGDGWCDQDNNNEICGYDGGDCCECTCVPQDTDDGTDDDFQNDCGNGFACIDPNAPCVDDDDITLDIVENCVSISVGNGFCDIDNNNEACAYDGGDCCECTCEDQPNQECGRSSSFACIDPEAPCVDDDSFTVDMIEGCTFPESFGNGRCDEENNTEECAYDGGDCCECTCESLGDDDGACSSRFACVDPSAPCVDEDSVTVDMLENCGFAPGIGDGSCREDNNTPECAYDGGDCCSCTCESPLDDDSACDNLNCKDPSAPCFGEETTTGNGDGSTGSSSDPDTEQEFVPSEQTEPLPTVEGAVEVGTKTEVSVSATAHDVRPGRSSGEVGCGQAGGNGCAPANAHDGISSEIESRWSCATMLLDDEGPCQIEFSFAEPQNIVDIQVAFWRGSERVRTLEVHVNGELIRTHESSADSTFNSLGVTANEANIVTLESISLLSNEWISLLEVLIFVTP